MLRAGNSIRFTPQEVEEFRSLGLDFDGLRTQDELEQALVGWTDALTQDRPALLEKSRWRWPRRRASSRLRS